MLRTLVYVLAVMQKLWIMLAESNIPVYILTHYS